MTFLLDTNVISESVKPQPDPNVVAWLAAVDEDQVFLSVASFAEIARGIALMPAGRRRDQLQRWLAEDLPTRFAGRILDIDRIVANTWGTLVARRQLVGMPLGTMDGFFAATAAAHGLTLATRNVQDFAACGISLRNPWEPQP